MFYAIAKNRELYLQKIVVGYNNIIMILDKIENRSKYFSLANRFETGLKFLKENDLNDLSEGKHEIQGEDVYIIISSYITKSPAESYPEAHKVYADIQYMVNGSEKIGYEYYSGQNIFKEYDTEKDFMLYERAEGSVILREGIFGIFFPDDIHQPGLIIGEPMEVRKAVVKVRL